jgi:hypothetical protein
MINAPTVPPRSAVGFREGAVEGEEEQEGAAVSGTKGGAVGRTMGAGTGAGTVAAEQRGSLGQPSVRMVPSKRVLPSTNSRYELLPGDIFVMSM